MWGDSTMLAPQGAASAAAKKGVGSSCALPCMQAHLCFMPTDHTVYLRKAWHGLHSRGPVITCHLTCNCRAMSCSVQHAVHR